MTDHTAVADTRGVSTTISYVLNLTLAALLISGLLFAAGSVVESERRSAIREEMEVIGNRLAIALQQANRTAALDTPSGADTTLRIEVMAPETVAGSSYTISVEHPAGAPVLVLTTEDPDVRVSVPLAMNHGVDATSIDGGPVVVVLTADGDLEVRER